MAMSKEEIVTAIKGLSVLDLVDLVKTLEQEFGVSAAAPVAVAAAPAAGGGGAPAEAAPVAEEPTEFNAILTDVGPNKINVIKAVREVVAGLGLREAKAVVDEAPKPIKENVSKEEAETIRAKLAEAGAKVEIKPAG